MSQNLVYNHAKTIQRVLLQIIDILKAGEISPAFTLYNRKFLILYTTFALSVTNYMLQVS